MAFLMKLICSIPPASGSVRTIYSLNASAEAATGAVNPTKKETQPLRKPANGEKSSERKAYSPPAFGNLAPSSL